MGSNSPHTQNYHYLRQPGSQHFATTEPTTMQAKSSGVKAPVTSAYPSPADDVMNTFSAPSSPLFQHEHKSPASKPTLPPLRSVVQIPSPSSSPQLPVASHRSIADGFFRSPVMSDNLNPAGGRDGAAFDRGKDAPLFPERMNVPLNATRPPPLFPSAIHPAPAQSNDLPNQTITRRPRKSIAHQSESLAPGTPMYGDSVGIWGKIQMQPEVYVPRIIADQAVDFGHNRQPSAESTPSNRRTSQGSASGRAQVAGSKRMVDSPLEMPPSKRREARKFSRPLAPSTSPQDTPLEHVEKKRVRRPQDPNKQKAPRATPDRVERNYLVYPDYCPPLSTLDSDDVAFPNIDWRAAYQDMSKHEDAHLLHAKEIKVASALVLTPSVYLYIKRRYFSHRLDAVKNPKNWNINAAQLACKGPDQHGITGIDVNKTSRLHKAFEKVGWLDQEHMQRFL